MVGSERLSHLPGRLDVSTGLALVVAGWLVGAVAGWWQAAVVGWVPLPVMCAIATRSCWQTATGEGLSDPARRLWRCIAVALAVLTAGSVSHMADALLGPGAPSQRLGPVTISIYAVVVLVVLWGLLRLPGRGVGGWLMFALDGGAVTVTAIVFAWHFSFRYNAQWMTVTGSVWPLFAVVVLAFVAVVAFVKAASVAADHIDRDAMRLFALAIVASTVTGALAPALAGRPHITTAALSIPAACVLVGRAAAAQRRAAAGPQQPGEHRTGPARRKWSVLPYTAVAATDTLLLVSGHGPDGRFLAAGAVALTAVVVLRQVVAFAQNNRLLTEVDSARDRLLHQTTHDDLTGLGNRRLLHERITAALAGAGTDPVHLVLIDLDDFKTVNDRLGHHIGDELLVAVGRRLHRAAGAGTTVVRLGGDEFAVLLPAGPPERADAAVRRLADALHRPVHAGQYELLVHASLGISDAAAAGDARELLRRADVAMYAAKERGKQRIARYEPAMDSTAAEHSVLGAELRRAMETGELHLTYQPIVALPTGAVVGAEVLVRWDHPERGPVPPAVFVPVAERNGLIVPLGEWILREACRQAVTWRDLPGGELLRKVSVNVSARQLREPDFPAAVAAILADTGLSPSSLTLEITETAVFDGGTALDSVRALHKLGVSLALDDFGTGHSSLGLLRTCPVDILKVDKSFVDEIAGGSRQAVVAAALIHIAEGMHLQAIAEGVETAAQAAHLYALGYRYAQGFHFARPLAAADLAALLAAGAADAADAGTEPAADAGVRAAVAA